MLNISSGKQDKFVFTTLEMLMPKGHFLRELEQYVDFTFIYDKVAYLYSSMGRKSIDPVVLVKMLLLGFLYGIDSERKLVKEIEVNIAFRWFLGIDLDEPVPDHSTISQTRRRRWKGTNIFEDIFTEIVRKCIDVGLVDGSLILTDSTHIKANASSERKEFVTVAIQPREYIKKLDELCEQEDLRVRACAISKGCKKHGYAPDKVPKTKAVVKSTTDPDCGLLKRPNKPGGFHYLNHQSVDGKSGIITDVFVTPANTEDFEPYADRIKYQISKYNFNIREVGIDSGYDWAEIHKEMFDLGIKTYTPLIDREKSIKSGVYPASVFQFDGSRNVYLCPNGCALKYSHINRSRHKRVYSASQRDCKDCPLKEKCLGGVLKCRTLQFPFFKEEIDEQRSNYGTKRYFEVQRKRRVYCEGNFAIQKDNHNLRKTRKRGNEKVTEHCLLSALALNLKRLVHYLKSKGCSPVLINFSYSVSYKRGFGLLPTPLSFCRLCQHARRGRPFYARRR
jgi:transposase